MLVVCVGNVCRSPFGERFLATRLPVGFEVASAGVAAVAGAPPEPETLALMEEYAVWADGFTARRLTPAMVLQSDLVLTATKALRAQVLERAPAALRRTFTVRELGALLDLVAPVAGDPRATVALVASQRSRVVLDDYDVPDPIGRPPAVHAQAARLMADALEQVAKGLTR